MISVFKCDQPGMSICIFELVLLTDVVDELIGYNVCILLFILLFIYLGLLY